MKSYTLTQAGMILGKSYQQTRDLLMKRRLLQVSPKIHIFEDDLKTLCQELNIVFMPLKSVVQDDFSENEEDWRTLNEISIQYPANYVITDPEEMRTALRYGKYPAKGLGQRRRWHVPSILDPQSWEPEQEKAWRVAKEHLEKAWQAQKQSDILRAGMELASLHWLNLMNARLGAEEVAVWRRIKEDHRDPKEYQRWLEVEFPGRKPTGKQLKLALESEFSRRCSKFYKERAEVLARVQKAPWSEVAHALPVGWRPL